MINEKVGWPKGYLLSIALSRARFKVREWVCWWRLQDTQILCVLWTRLSRESPAALFMCERQTLEKVQTPIVRTTSRVHVWKWLMNSSWNCRLLRSIQGDVLNWGSPASMYPASCCCFSIWLEMCYYVKHTSLTCDRLDCLFGRLPVSREQFEGPCKLVWVTSCHRVVCLQYLSLPSWAACMFVFGFVGDSLVATTTEPLSRAIQRLEILTQRKQKEWFAEEAIAEVEWPLFSSFRCRFGLEVPESCEETSPSLSPRIVFDWQRAVISSGKFNCPCIEAVKTASLSLLCPWLTVSCRACCSRTIRNA